MPSLVCALACASMCTSSAGGKMQTLPTSSPMAAGTPRVQPQHWTLNITSAWTTIATNPNLGNLTGDKQQPVDFAVWRAADGRWQLWSCIRGTKVGGETRLLYRWQSPEGGGLTSPHWDAVGIAMEGNPTVGENVGGLQAPHVVHDPADGKWHMLFGAFVVLATCVWDRTALHRTTPHHTTPHHTTPHHTTLHHTTPHHASHHHTTPHHKSLQHSTTHNTAQHNTTHQNTPNHT